MNLYRIKLHSKKIEHYLVAESLIQALTRAKDKYSISVTGLWLIEKGVM